MITMLSTYFVDGKPIPKDELTKWVDEDTILIAAKEGLITTTNSAMYVITSKGKQHINIK